MREAEWIVAARQQLGVGLDEIAGRHAVTGEKCSCHAHGILDHTTDQHSRGRPYGHGFRSTAHKNIQNALVSLAHKGDFNIADRDVTCPLSGNAKEMDIVLCDAQRSSTTST